MLLALCWLLFGMMALAEDDEFEEFDDDPFDELDDISGFGVEQHTFGDFRCLLNEETGDIITACYIGNDTDIVVPAEIEGHKVVGIGEGTFQFAANAAAITSVTLPEGIEFLGNSAFKLCQSLKEIVIPEGVVRIEYGCFGGCMALEKVELPERFVVQVFGKSSCEVALILIVHWTLPPLHLYCIIFFHRFQ